MTTDILKYDIAKKALDAARSFDEVKSIIDKSQQIAEYARRAKDTEMIDWATELNLWAKRKVGEMLNQLPKHPGGRPSLKTSGPAPEVSVSELGLTHDQSADWRVMAAVPEEKLKAAIAESKATGLSEKAVMRRIKPPRPPRPPKPTPPPVEVDPMDEEAPPSDADLAREQLDIMAELNLANERMRKVLDADEPLKAALKEAAEWKERHDLVKRLNIGLTNDLNVAIKDGKYWRRRFEALEKEHKLC